MRCDLGCIFRDLISCVSPAKFDTFDHNVVFCGECRQNAIQLEEKEKREKELRNQIIEEADQFKEEFHKKRELACENNKAANREKEKVSSLPT